MKKIMKGYVFRLYPSDKQIQLIEKSFGCSRYIYNSFLGIDKPKYPNMKLIKQNFYTDYDVSNYDLITGILPCSAIDKIIEAACKN